MRTQSHCDCILILMAPGRPTPDRAAALHCLWLSPLADGWNRARGAN